MGGRGKKFGERKPRGPRPPKVAKAPKARKVRTSRRTKTQVLFYTDRAQKAFAKAKADNKDFVTFEALTGKRVRGTTEKFVGNTGTKIVRRVATFDQISVPESAKNIPLTGKGNINNVHKWHKGTQYDEQNARPFRVQKLKNGKLLLNPGDATRYAHYIATGGDQKNIAVTFNVERMTRVKYNTITRKFFNDNREKITNWRNTLPAKEAEKKIGNLVAKNKTMRRAEADYMLELSERQNRRELDADRTTTPVRYGGSTGNSAGDLAFRSQKASRRTVSDSGREGTIRWLFNAAATTGSRYYPGGRKSTSRGSRTIKKEGLRLIPANEVERVFQRRNRRRNV